MVTLSIMKYKLPLLFAAAVLVVWLFFFCLGKFMKYRRKKREIDLAAADRIRDENLNHIILNSHADRENNREVYKPYDVDYGSKEKGGGLETSAGKRGQPMLQLIEKTELSTRKFVLNPAKRIRIGSDLQDNDISVLAEGISLHQCEIFAAGGKVYIKNTGEGARTIIRRKNQKAIADNKGIRLLSGDQILLGSVSYDITITN